MFDIGGGELLMILMAVVMLFGPKKLPEIAKTIGKGMQQIKNAQANITAQINTATNDINDEIKKETEIIAKPIEKEIQSLRRDQMFD
ncbi:MAG: Sec-independent protein translocase subunit TatA/TatB [Candidatus Kapaibacteriota bacterium]|jgi:sec-independent protein translocase protein TatA